MVAWSKTRPPRPQSGCLAGFFEMRPRLLWKSFGLFGLREDRVICQLVLWCSLSFDRTILVWMSNSVFMSGLREWCHNLRRCLFLVRALLMFPRRSLCWSIVIVVEKEFRACWHFSAMFITASSRVLEVHGKVWILYWFVE